MRLGSLGQLFDDLLGWLFCPHEQDVTTLGCSFAQKVGGFSNLLGRAREIDDIDSIAWAEDELLHLGIPLIGAMSKVNPCFKQSFHL